MRKLTKKHIISIVIVVVLALTVTGVALGAKANQKNNDKKVESVEKEKESIEEEKEGAKDEEVSDEVETVVEETVEETPTTDTTSQTDKKTSNKNATANKNTTTTTNKTTATKPSQPVTQPTGGHVHNWTEVKETVTVPEKGHYETIYGQKTVCNACQTDISELTRDERDEHFKKEPCRYGTYTVSRVEAGQKWIVDTPATTEARVVGYKCSCGATREKTQYAGMYSIKDQASWDRLNACKSFFKEGLAGEGSDLTVWASYGYGRSVTVCNDSTNGAWMWISLTDWKLDDYSYLQDSVKEGIIDQEEAKLVEAIYEEIPSIFKGAIERVAPQGGTELYNYVEKLVIQANGNPVKVDELEGAQGIIPENIPGLYVTIEELRGGFALMFWAE